MDFQEAIAATNEALGTSVCRALEHNGFNAVYAPTAKEAAAHAMALIGEGQTIGVPGSVTVRQLGLIEALEKKGCTVYQHWTHDITPEERVAALKGEFGADWLLTSANAITTDGAIVNYDGTGNRVAAMCWGFGKVIYIISIDKAVCDVEAAINRVRDVATPPNAKRLGRTTPCTTLGYCTDCDSPECPCRILTVMEKCPFGRECHVILVGEKLGY